MQREVQGALAMLDTLQEHRESRQQAIAAQTEQLHAQTDAWRGEMYTYIKVRYTRSLCVKARAALFPHARPNESTLGSCQALLHGHVSNLL